MTRKKVAQALRILSNYIGSYGIARGPAIFVYDIFRWAVFPRGKLVSVRSPSGKRLLIRARSSDFLVYDEVVLRRCYALDGYPQAAILWNRYRTILEEGRTPLIIDAGANVGFASVILKEAFPESTVIAVEPMRENAELAAINLQGVAGIHITEKCLWHQRGDVQVVNDEAKAFSFRFKESGAKVSAGIETVTIDQLVEAHLNAELFILKMDVEGAENKILACAGAWWDTLPCLMIEPHDWLSLGQQSLKGVMEKPHYSAGDIILKDSIAIFLPQARQLPAN